MTRKTSRPGRRRTLKRFLPGGIAFLVLLSALAGIAYLGYHGIRVREITITGNHHLKHEEIISLMGVKRDDPLFETSNSEYYRRLRKSPWVTDAMIRKELTGKMILKIRESVPAAILILEDIPYLVDKEGTVLEGLREGAVFLLPVIREIHPSDNNDTYREAMKFVNILNEKRVLSYGGRIELSGNRPEDIALQLDDVRILVGSGNIEKKLERLVVVREEIKKKDMDVEYYDIRYDNKIIVKPAAPPAKGKTSADGKTQKKR